MGKPIVNMTDWHLYVYEGRYNLSGVADVHPRLGKNTYVAHSSSLERYSFEDDVLTYETRNTIYVCPLKYMAVNPYGNVVPEYKEKLTYLDENSNSILDRIIAATARMTLQADKMQEENPDEKWMYYRVDSWEEMGLNAESMEDEMARKIICLREVGRKEIAEAKEQEKARLLDIVRQYEDSIYLEVSKVDTGDTLAYHLGEDMGIVEPRLHSGMFQDSVLYMKWASEEDPCSLDFRYFPKGCFSGIMETYSWSDNIKQAVIKNAGESVLEFNKYEIEPGETKVFTPESHQQGLISPDCHNGKSMFFIPAEEDEE